MAPGRKIKRGWTEPDKDSRLRSSSSCASRSATSKYTNRAECIFRVQLPPNKETERSSLTRNEKTQGRKKGKKATTVHEFEKSVTQPSFIRTEPYTKDVDIAAEYIDGKGWVNKDGKLVEEESKTQLRYRSRTDNSQVPRLSKSTGVSIHHTSNGQQLSHSAADGIRDQTENKSTIASGDGILFDNETIELGAADEETSSSGTSQSGSDSRSEPKEELEQIPEAESADANNASEATSTANLTVHPLETLFKRPSQAASQTKGKRSLEIKTTFNFFEPNEDQSILQTPFTTRDLQLRGLRSAAPNPDTALPTRRFFAESVSPSKSGTDDEEPVEAPSGSGLAFGESAQKEEPQAESDFAKWFWEHRGENNRAWKRRRREAMKEKRQRGNRQKVHRIG